MRTHFGGLTRGLISLLVAVIMTPILNYLLIGQ